jgi:hypothetical protein
VALLFKGCGFKVNWKKTVQAKQFFFGLELTKTNIKKLRHYFSNFV